MLVQRRLLAHVEATIALALLVSMTASATPARSPGSGPEAACGAYDLHVLTLIEDHGLVKDTEAEVLREAAFTMLRARRACRVGDMKGTCHSPQEPRADVVQASVRCSPRPG